MTKSQLGQKLCDMYSNAQPGEMVVMIHLFGIKYAKEIKQSGATSKEIADLAKIPASYKTEISKGVKLNKYVRVNE